MAQRFAVFVEEHLAALRGDHVHAAFVLALHEHPLQAGAVGGNAADIDHAAVGQHGELARIQAGDYDGLREINGKPLPSIFREYADGLAKALAAHYAK